MTRDPVSPRPSPVVRLDELTLVTQTHGDRFAASMAAIAAPLGATHLGARLVEVPPGKAAWPFHSHHGNDEMFGGNGVDRFFAGQGRDSMTGGAGDDQFFFLDETGRDRIYDFTPGSDEIGVRSEGVRYFDDLVIEEANNGDAIIYLDDGDTGPGSDWVRLVGVSPDELSYTDFFFDSPFL